MRRRLLVLAILFLWAPLIVASGAATETAWDLLMQHEPARLQGVASLEKEILRSLSPEAWRQFSAGASPLEVVLLSGETLDAFLERRGLGTFEMRWFSSDNGAARLSAGALTLTGTFGQAEVGRVAGGDFTLDGGFSTRSGAQVENAIFMDGFESGDLSRWTVVVP